MTALELLWSGLGLAGALVVAWASLRAPSLAVAVVVASVPLQAYARVGTDSAGITWTQAWLWAYLATGALLFASGAIAVRLDATTLLLAAVVACYILTRPMVIDGVAWRNEVYRWAVTLAFFVVARASVRPRRLGGALVVVAAVGAIWTALVAVAQVVADSGPDSFQRAGRARAYSTFGEPNTFGAFAAGCLVVLVACLLFTRSTLRRWWTGSAIVGAAFAGTGLVLSQSRGAVAATALVLGAMVAVWVGSRIPAGQPWRVAAVVAASLGALVVTPRVAADVARAGRAVEVTTASWADQERLSHWGAATTMVVESTGRGIGAGQFDARYRESTPAWRFRIPQGHAHSAYLQVAAEAGLVGLGAYVGLLVTVLLGLARGLGRDGPTVDTVAALAATAVFALHNLVDYLHVLNLPIILVAWWAMALAQSEGSTETT